MDDSHFDRLARSLGRAGSRRRALGGLLAGAIGLAGLDDAEDAAAHNALTACKKKSGKARKKCVKKAKTHNATHVPGTPTGNTGGQPPADPCAGVTCGPVSHGMSACQNGACVITVCEGDFYDVDGNAANGCEVSDDDRDNHTLTTASRAGTLQTPCTGSSSTQFSGEIVSDNRTHNPAPEGFDPMTGSAPDFWVVQATATCASTLRLDLTTSGGSPDNACYLLRFYDSSGQESGAIPVTGSGPQPRNDFGV